MFTDGRQQRQLNHNTTTYCGCRCCLPSVNTICGRIMIGLSLLSSVSEHNMNPIIIRPHIMFTDGRQQRQPNHNTTTYCAYWRTTTTINPIIIPPHIMFTEWSYYYSVYFCCRPSVNIICGRIMIELSLLSSVSKHNMWSNTTTLYVYWQTTTTTTQSKYDTYCVYWRTTKTINQIIIRPHIVFTERRQRQPNHNTTTYCVYWRKSIMIELSLSSVSKHNMWSCYDCVVVVVFRQ
jgi:hypothetical protein